MGGVGDVDIIKVAGAIRFVCECGQVADSGVFAVAHTFEGHEVVRERYSLGSWYYLDTLDGRSVAEMMWNKLKESGEEPPAFIERMKQRTREKEEELQAIEAVEREMGIR